MLKLAVIAIALAVSVPALAGDTAATHAIDLRASHALKKLKQSNPAHFEKIQRMLDGLHEEPKRAEGDWLQVNFNARDVDLSRHIIRTSNPPKQLLRFTLDDVRYTLYVTRGDLTATVKPAK